MTDAVREYKEWVRENYAKHAAEMWNPMDAGYANGIDATETKADAAIAELEAKVEELDDKLMEAEGAHDAARRWFEEQKKQFARAEKAEAERDQALFVADGWHRQFKRAAKARREEKARAKKATEYARIEVKRKNEAVEREAAAIERAEKAEAEVALRDRMLDIACRSGINAVASNEATRQAMIQEVVDERLADLRARAERREG